MNDWGGGLDRRTTRMMDKLIVSISIEPSWTNICRLLVIIQSVGGYNADHSGLSGHILQGAFI